MNADQFPERIDLDAWQAFAAAALSGYLASNPQGSSSAEIALDVADFADRLYAQWKQRAEQNLEGR